jgi:hypothetical protein
MLKILSKSIGLLAASFALGLALWATQGQAQAQCSPPSTTGPDTVTCSGSVSGYEYYAQGGDDTISNTGNFSNSSRIIGEGGDDLIISSGTFNNNSALLGREGNDTIINSGNFNDNSAIIGDAGNDSISNSGAFSNGGGIAGEDGNDTISNSGAFSTGARILGRNNDDTVILLPGSAFDGLSFVDGGPNTDSLLLYVNTPVNFDTKFPQCQGQVSTAAMQAAGCFVPWEGGILYFTNFERIKVFLLGIIGANMDIPAGPQVICDDGRVKVFKLPNGDVEYYSGFNLVNAPNGFMVAKVTLVDLANGVRTFPTAAQTPNPLGWTVKVSQNGSVLSGQVFDETGAPVGNECRH